MAESPSHKFGQLIGNLIEEILIPKLQAFCEKHNLYLDKPGPRGEARPGRKVTWIDKYGNSHDLDFVIEKGGNHDQKGRPVAFIEVAWRRYTKHSRNKAQEIQGAILPIAEQYIWDKPFLGAVLAGVFTDGSINQMKSSGFEVLLFPYTSIVESFKAIQIDVKFDEKTPDSKFNTAVKKISKLRARDWEEVKKQLIDTNEVALKNFLNNLKATLGREIQKIILIPLFGEEKAFNKMEQAVDFINKFDPKKGNGEFRKYEAIVKYTNGDEIQGSFINKGDLINFLQYVSQN